MRWPGACASGHFCEGCSGALGARYLAANAAVALLLDETVVGPETLFVGVGRIDEFDVVADHLHHAE
jgi:hypothetical protein